MKFADLVEVDLRASHGGKRERLYVVGAMAYSADVLLVASDATVGMPVNKGNCELISEGHNERARYYRKRYMKRYPQSLRPLREMREK